MSNLKKNIVYNISYQMLMLILPIITTPYISRILGPEGIGIYSYTNSIASYFVLFAMLGVINYGNRSIAMIREDKFELSRTFWSIYLLQLLTSILAIIFYIFYFSFYVKEYQLIVLIQGIYLISAMLDINWFFFGIEQFKLTVTRNVFVRLASVCLIFIFVKNSGDLWIYSIIMTGGILISQIILWGNIRKFIFYVRPKFNDIYKHLYPSLVLFIPVITISIYRIMDKIMLGSMSSISQVGFYENSDKIISIPMGIITALGTVMLPRMSNLVTKGNHELSAKYIRNSMQFVIFLACAITFGLAGIAPIFVPIFFGTKFLECSNLIINLSPIIVFVSWANVIRTQYLIPNSKDKIYIISVLIGAFLNFVINSLLIGKFGAEGAVVGTVVAEMSVALYQTIMVRKNLEIGLYLKSNFMFIFFGLIMFLIVRGIGNLLNSNLLTLTIEVTVGAIVYIALSYIYMYKQKSDLIINFRLKLTGKRNR